jgi:cytochrome P450
LKRPAGIPPGPRGVPYLGYLPFIREGNRGVLFQKIAKKYGQIYSVYIGKELYVVINDYTNIKKALVDNAEVFSGRPESFRHRPDLPYGRSKSIFANHGQFWREHRRFSLSTFREFGIGKSSIEPALQNEIDYFLQAINDKQGKPFDISDLLGMSVCNNICILEFGKRFEYHDEYFIQLKRAVDFAVHQPNFGDTFDGYIRLIKLSIPMLKARDIGSTLSKSIQDFCTQKAEEHLKTYQPGSKTDYIDAYYTEKAERERTNNNAEMFDYEALHENLNLLFFAGTETTTTTLRWGLIYMMQHPDVQRKVQQEIDEVVGRERLPTMDDKLRMPYTDATILEISRMATLVPSNVVHSTLEDVHLGGYLIPKDTPIHTNLWAVHHDEKLFPDPFTFRPERFINERGQFVKHEAVIPFSLGKRFCLGEPLARMELFLYFASMLQKFTFVNPEGQVLTGKELVGGNVRAPEAFLLRAIRRED